MLEKIKDQRLDARYILGKMYEEQAVNHPEYFDMGLAEIRQAAELGFSEAQVDMAETLRVGGTTSKTLSDAVKSETLKQSADYLAMAVAQGNVIAMRNLGWYYRDGIGIPQDAVKAKELLSQAANQGDSIAKEYLDQLGE